MKILDFTLTYEDGMRGAAFENAKSKSVDGIWVRRGEKLAKVEHLKLAAK